MFVLQYSSEAGACCQLPNKDLPCEVCGRSARACCSLSFVLPGRNNCVPVEKGSGECIVMMNGP